MHSPHFSKHVIVSTLCFRATRLDYSYYTVSAPEEQRARAMANDSHQNDQPRPTISPFDSSQAPTTSVQPPSASKASESALSTHVGGKRKRNVKAKDGKGKKQKKQKKTRAFVVSDDEDDDDDDEEGEEEEEVEEPDDADTDEDDADDDDDKNDEEEEDEENAGNNTRLKGLNPNAITPFEEPSTLTDKPTVATPPGSPPARSAQLDQSVPRSPLAPCGTPIAGPTGTIPGPQSTTPPPIPTLLSQPSTRPSPTLVTPQAAPKPPLPLDPSWPAWFQKAYTDLSLTFLSPELTSAIHIYVGIEKKAGFVVGSPNAGFKVDNRPPEVAFWVGRGRKSAPLVKNLPSFEAGWWKWWKGIQPKWRSAVEVEGPLTAAHREVTDGEGGWASVDKHGQNAFLTVLSCLVWWGTALNGHQGESAGWTAAVDDVHWVLTNLARYI